MSMNSRAIAQRSIARQDNAPQDTSLLWLDTSFDPAKLKQYNASTSNWEPIASSVVTKQDTQPTAPTVGDLWQDTSRSPAVLKVYDGSNWVIQNPAQTKQNTESLPLSRIHSVSNQNSVSEKPFISVVGGEYRLEDNDGAGSSVSLTFADGTVVSDSVNNGTKVETFSNTGVIVELGLSAGAYGAVGGDANAYLELEPVKPTHTHNI